MLFRSTDFSDFSDRALGYAVALARWYDARISSAFVIPPLSSTVVFPPGIAPVPVEPAPKAWLQEKVERFLAPARDAGVPADAEVLEGNPAEAILSMARTMPADLLLLGTHGRGGFERWVLGSVTEKVLRKASCPTLTVTLRAMPPSVEGRPPFERILCPVDFSAPSLRAVEYALTLAQEAYGRIVLLHVMEVLSGEEFYAPGQVDLGEYHDRAELDLHARLKQSIPEAARNWCQPEDMVTRGKPYKQILRVAEEQKADLIVMGIHGRNPLDLMLFGSTTQHVVRAASCPVLTIRSG